jgi:tetratricopeptide (TPR) repeat protein
MAKLVNLRAMKSRKEKEREKGIESKPGPIISATPEEKTFLMFSATVAYQKGDFAKAAVIYKGLEVLMPEWSKPSTGRGMALFRASDYDGAERCYRRAIEIDPKDQEAHLYLGELLWRIRMDRDEAMQHLVTARTLDEGSILGRRAGLTIHDIENAPRA